MIYPIQEPQAAFLRGTDPTTEPILGDLLIGSIDLTLGGSNFNTALACAKTLKLIAPLSGIGPVLRAIDLASICCRRWGQPCGCWAKIEFVFEDQFDFGCADCFIDWRWAHAEASKQELAAD
jgi:hypothetical protein